MALDKTVLALELIRIESEIVQESLGDMPMDDATRSRIESKCNQTADAIYNWLLTATVSVNVNTTTTHAISSINVAGTAAAQTNPAPVFGTGSGSGTGTIS